jgi:DNA-binding transcriptional regulator YdaS (Cro superfamily)
MKSPFEKLVKHFGSQNATALALGVKQGTVSGWVRGIHGCTAEVAMRALPSCLVNKLIFPVEAICHY